METTEHVIEKKKSMLVSGSPVLYWNFREERELINLVTGYSSPIISSIPLCIFPFSSSFRKSISLWDLYLLSFIALI